MSSPQFSTSAFFLIFKSDLFLFIKYIYSPFSNQILFHSFSRLSSSKQTRYNSETKAIMQGQNLSFQQNQTQHLSFQHYSPNAETLYSLKRKSKLFHRKLARARPWEPTFSIFDPTSISKHSLSVSLY